MNNFNNFCWKSTDKFDLSSNYESYKCILACLDIAFEAGFLDESELSSLRVSLGQFYSSDKEFNSIPYEESEIIFY